jgi:hypothetical protein
MTIIWTTPKTWAAGELVTAAMLNTHIRDNLEYLKTPPAASYILNESGDYATTSTSFVNVDGTKLALTIATAGGDVLVGFSGTIINTSGTAGHTFFDVEVDTVRTAGDDGYIAVSPAGAGTRSPVTFLKLIQGLSAGSHTFKLQWKVAAGTASLFSGAGSSNGDLHPQFFVREL